jgi:adenylate cyclase
LVILGSSSLNLSDRVTTPLAPSTSGFLVHASALSGLLDAQEGVAPRLWPGRWLALAFTLIVACLAAYTFPRLSALSNIGILGGASIIWLYLAYLICPHDDFFAPTGPLLSNLFLLTIAVPFGWQVSQGKSHRLLGTLQQYVAKAVVDELLRSDLKDPLAPRQLHVTTLIADMEAYTSHVEQLPVQDAAKLTRDFLECLTGPVLAMGGTLDKYTGDGLVAFWGAPLPVENHADLALDAGLQILNNIRAFNFARAQAGLKPVRVRIGVESGIAMAGDFGTSFRSIYTAVGDSVNVASRLEDVARNLPHDIIIGQGTVDCATRHTFTALGERILKGKEHPSALFTLQASTPEESGA